MHNKNNKQKKRIRVFPVIIVTLISAYIYFTFLYVYHGKVLDADTKQPIEGAVVVASWVEETANVAGANTRLKDVKEVLTDKNGEWRIRGPRGRDGGNITAIFTFLTGTYYTNLPLFIVFKPGYCSWPKGFRIDACKEKMKGYNYSKSDNIGGVVELPKLIKREDRRRALPAPVRAYRAMDPEKVLKKQKEFFRLINEESRNIGLKEYRSYYKIFKEKKNE